MTEKIILCLFVALYLVLALFAALFLDFLNYGLENAYAMPSMSKPGLQRYYPDDRNSMTAPYLRALCGFHGSTQMLSAYAARTAAEWQTQSPEPSMKVL